MSTELDALRAQLEARGVVRFPGAPCPAQFRYPEAEAGARPVAVRGPARARGGGVRSDRHLGRSAPRTARRRSAPGPPPPGLAVDPDRPEPGGLRRQLWRDRLERVRLGGRARSRRHRHDPRHRARRHPRGHDLPREGVRRIGAHEVAEGGRSRHPDPPALPRSDSRPTRMSHTTRRRPPRPVGSWPACARRPIACRA